MPTGYYDFALTKLCFECHKGREDSRRARLTIDVAIDRTGQKFISGRISIGTFARTLIHLCVLRKVCELCNREGRIYKITYEDIIKQGKVETVSGR